MAKARKLARRGGTTRAKARPSQPKKVSPVPKGYHSVTAYLTVSDGEKALEFYTRAFGARVTERMPGPGGKLMHAELRIGDSIVMLSDEFPEMGGGTRSPQALGGASGYLFLYVPDVDASFRRAVDAGCKVTMPPADMFWGDRFGKVIDPFGHHWGLGTHKEDVSPAEVKRRGEAAMAQMGRSS